MPSPLSNILAQLRDDVESSMFADWAVEVEYRKAGGASFAPVLAVVGVDRRERAKGVGARTGGVGGFGHGAMSEGNRAVMVLATQPGEEVGVGTGVGLHKNVFRLSSGDSFRVPGVLVGRPEETTVIVGVGARIESVAGAYWRGDLTL